MKKILASAGLATLGATGLHAAYAPGLTTVETSKPWSVSASLRGFYDDNYNTAPSHPMSVFTPKAKSSFGFEVSPGVALNLLPTDQTYVGLSYVYSMRYYTERENNPIDHSHEFTAKVKHKFSERYKLDLADSFLYAQEPELIESTGIISAPTRALRGNSDVLRNRLDIDFSARVTDLTRITAGYQNIWYDYLQSADDLVDPSNPTGAGSRSALLDRIEHLIHVDGRWQMRDNLEALVGYQYGVTDYTSEEPILPGVPGDIRDSSSHYFYIGASYEVTSQLSAQGQVGVQYTSYESLPGSTLNPYVDMSGVYYYMAGSYVQFGFRHARNATDVVGGPGDITTDQESSSVYASINHKITPRITGSLLGQFQNSTFHGGAANDSVDNIFLLGVNFAYQINPYLAAEAGYNWDRLDSDLPDRSFSRNRIYMGIHAKY